MDYKAMLGKLLENMRKTEPERLARLEDLGYDTSKVYFHGGPSGIDEFKATAPIMKYSGQPIAGHAPATFFSEDPRFSSSYAMGSKESSVYPVFLKKEGLFDPNNPKDIENLLQKYPYTWQKISAQELSQLGPADENWAVVEGMSESIKGSGYGGAKIRESFLPYDKLKNDLEIAENVAVFDPEENVKSIWAKGMAKKGLMTGAVAMDPLHQIGQLVDVYRTNQEKVADAITKQVTQPFGEADEMQKNIMRFGLDPINLVPGAAGVGIGVLEMVGK